MASDWDEPARSVSGFWAGTHDGETLGMLLEELPHVPADGGEPGAGPRAEPEVRGVRRGPGDVLPGPSRSGVISGSQPRRATALAGRDPAE